MNIFVVKILTRSPGFGEDARQERDEIGRILNGIANNLGSGAPLVTELRDRNNLIVGTCEFGEESLNT